MIKNIFLPVALIVLTSALTIYLWYEPLPLSLFGIIGFMTLGLGCMYISYFIFYAIFPDARNKPLPPVQDLLIEYKPVKGKPQAITKGSVWGVLVSVLLTAGGVYSWIRLADRYARYQLDKYGQTVNAVIIKSGYSKGIGTYREYEYITNTGDRHTDKFSNNTFSIGDTITIVYSINRPSINKVVTPHEEE